MGNHEVSETADVGETKRGKKMIALVYSPFGTDMSAVTFLGIRTQNKGGNHFRY